MTSANAGLGIPGFNSRPGFWMTTPLAMADKPWKGEVNVKTV